MMLNWTVLQEGLRICSGEEESVLDASFPSH